MSCWSQNVCNLSNIIYYESIFHALWECHFSRLIRKQSKWKGSGKMHVFFFVFLGQVEKCTLTLLAGVKFWFMTQPKTTWSSLYIQYGSFLVEEIKNLLKFRSSSNVTFQSRECINVARGIGKFSLLENDNMYCVEHGPKWFMELTKVDSDSCNFFFV